MEEGEAWGGVACLLLAVKCPRPAGTPSPLHTENQLVRLEDARLVLLVHSAPQQEPEDRDTSSQSQSRGVCEKHTPAAAAAAAAAALRLLFNC